MPLNRYLVPSALVLLLGGAIWAAVGKDDANAVEAPRDALPNASAGLMSRLAGAGIGSSPAAPPEDGALRELAAQLPADVRADVLLRLAAVPGARDAADLVVQAYRLAPQAARPLPGLIARPWAASDDAVLPPRTAGLDQLSLQLRAMRTMLAVAPEREGLLSSPLPAPRPASCDADYVDDPGPAYEFASETLPAQAVARTTFVLQVLGRAKTEVDLAPAVKFVAALPPLPPGDEILVAHGLGALFARAQGNDPGFTATAAALNANMETLLARYAPQSATWNELAGAFRNYVAVHLAAARCPVSLGGAYRQRERDMFAQAAADVQVASNDTTAPPAPPAGSNAAAVADAIRHAAAATMARMHADPTDPEDVAPAGQQDADSLLDVLDGASAMAAAASDGTGLVQRVAMHAVLRYLEYAPPGPQRDKAFARLATLLSGGSAAQDHDRRLGDLRDLATSMRQWPDGADRLRQLAAGHDAVVRVYAQLMLNKQFP